MLRSGYSANNDTLYLCLWITRRHTGRAEVVTILFVFIFHSFRLAQSISAVHTDFDGFHWKSFKASPVTVQSSIKTKARTRITISRGMPHHFVKFEGWLTAVTSYYGSHKQSHAHTPTHPHPHKPTHTHTHTHTATHTNPHTQPHTPTHTNPHTHTHSHTHIYTHTHTHIHTHTRSAHVWGTSKMTVHV